MAVEWTWVDRMADATTTANNQHFLRPSMRNPHGGHDGGTMFHCHKLVLHKRRKPCLFVFLCIQSCLVFLLSLNMDSDQWRHTETEKETDPQRETETEKEIWESLAGEVEQVCNDYGALLYREGTHDSQHTSEEGSTKGNSIPGRAFPPFPSIHGLLGSWRLTKSLVETCGGPESLTVCKLLLLWEGFCCSTLVSLGPPEEGCQVFCGSVICWIEEFEEVAGGGGRELWLLQALHCRSFLSFTAFGKKLWAAWPSSLFFSHSSWLPPPPLPLNMDDSTAPSAARFFPTIIAAAIDLKLPEIPIRFSTHPTKTNPQNAQNTRPKISQICQKKDPISLSLSLSLLQIWFASLLQFQTWSWKPRPSTNICQLSCKLSCTYCCCCSPPPLPVEILKALTAGGTGSTDHGHT